MKKKTYIIFFMLIILSFIQIIFIKEVEAATIKELRNKYPKGRHWNHIAGDDHYYKYGIIDQGRCNNPDGWTNSPCASHGGVTAKTGEIDCNSFDKGQQCTGFARKLFYDYYGVYATSCRIHTDINELKPGDILRYTGGSSSGHDVWILSIEGNKLSVVECNWGARCIINWDRIINKDDINVSKIYSAPREINDNDIIAPTFSECYIDVASMKNDEYKIIAKVSDNTGVKEVKFPTWTEKDGQDDLIWKDGIYNSKTKTWECYVKKSEHNNLVDMYITHVYAYDFAGNNTCYMLSAIPMGTTLANLSSFRGKIILSENENYVVGTNKENNVVLKNKIDVDNSQEWKFIRNSDGSYCIENLSNNKILNVSNNNQNNATNIITSNKSNSKTQRFYIMNYNENYRIVSAISSDLKALNVDTNTIKNDNNINLYETINLKNIAQIWKIQILEKYSDGVEYSTHVQNEGWQNYVSNGKVSGTIGKSLRLEGIRIRTISEYSGDIEYSTHIENIGWQEFVKNDALSGTEGRSLRLEAIKIKLTGEIAEKYDIYYRVHSENLGWLDFAKNGEEAGTSGLGYRLEGIEIKLIKKGENAPGKTSAPFISKGEVNYSAHVQNIGWQSYVKNGKTAGTLGKSFRLEGIKIKLNSIYNGNIEYSTHVENIGWQEFVKNDTLSGSLGKGLRTEAIKVRLTGDVSNYYDIYYRVHSQNFGWLGWAKNGEESGTTGYGYRIEAIEIMLVKKGSKAPGSTINRVLIKQSAIDSTAENEIKEYEILEDKISENIVIEDKIEEDKIPENIIIEDQIAENKIVENEILKDKVFKNEIAENKILENEIMEDRVSENEVEENRTI